MGTKPDFETAQPPQPGRKYFTVEEANRALPYVARITHDIREAYQKAVGLQERMDRPHPEDDTQQLHDDYERSIDQLNRYVDELSEVGVELKDYDLGLVDFPALFQGREICLCWKHGEQAIAAWHETDAGFAGRQAIALLSAQPSAT